MQLCVFVMRKMKILVVQSVQLTSRPSSSFTTLCRGQVQTSNLEEEGRGGEGERQRCKFGSRISDPVYSLCVEERHQKS